VGRAGRDLAVEGARAPGDAPDNEFPLVLVTGRVLQHYNAGTMTRRTHNIDIVDRDWLEVHPVDAARLWISDGEKVSARSRVGQTGLYAKVTERIEPGHVFTSFHFPEARATSSSGSRRTSTRPARSTRWSPSTCGRWPSSRRSRRPSPPPTDDVLG
jgi:predicted molibdopterin-dependent oxidoreductase YjgC